MVYEGLEVALAFCPCHLVYEGLEGPGLFVYVTWCTRASRALAFCLCHLVYEGLEGPGLFVYGTWFTRASRALAFLSMSPGLRGPRGSWPFCLCHLVYEGLEALAFCR